ncbi:transposase, mutator type [Rhodococcus aetherivorans]|nr:transposase, mutator type [Rhodococcus aetherivorans]
MDVVVSVCLSYNWWPSRYGSLGWADPLLAGATIRLRPRVTKGSRAAGLAMAYKLIEAAQSRWRAVNAPQMVAPVRAGALFHKGRFLERPVEITPGPSPHAWCPRSPDDSRSTGFDYCS